MLDAPDGYQGGDISNGDIVAVDGQMFYFDKLEGCKFIELNAFDSADVRQAVHVQYGWFTDIKDAEVISYSIANACHDIDVPCGYLGDYSVGCAYNGNRPFLPGVSDEENFLHPNFIKGDDAQVFIKSLTELTDTEAQQWMKISKYLKERNPITLQDLQDAREKFAPELLLPEVIRPLHRYIPANADKSEIAYLADKVEGMDSEQRGIFNAATEIGWQCGSVAEIINLTENLDCFEIHPALNETMYGEFQLQQDWSKCEAIVERLQKSEDPAETALANHIAILNRAVDVGMYGHHAAKEIGGIFTSHGMLTTNGSGEPRDVYRGTHVRGYTALRESQAFFATLQASSVGFTHENNSPSVCL
jgi:hypothetical protein